jgi:hypothetical protein
VSTPLLIVTVGLGLYGLHRLALMAEERGWIHYRKAGRGGSIGNALLEVHSILEPQQKHVVEERKREHAEERESGDPPEAGARSLEVTRRLKQMWPDPTVRERVRSQLMTYGQERFENEPDRVRLAILKLSEGDEARIARFVRDAKTDYRDVLMWAEYPREGAALWTAKSRLSTEEEQKLAALRAEDRREYEEWRKP